MIGTPISITTGFLLGSITSLMLTSCPGGSDPEAERISIGVFMGVSMIGIVLNYNVGERLDRHDAIRRIQRSTEIKKWDVDFR